MASESPGKIGPRSQIVQVVVKVVLPVIACPDCQFQVGPHMPGILNKSGEVFFEKDKMPLPLLQQQQCWLVRLIRGKTGKGIRPQGVREVISATAADVRHVDAELYDVFPCCIGHEVRTIWETIQRLSAEAIGVLVVAGLAADCGKHSADCYSDLRIRFRDP